ncbi:ABC transporter ATP-binding protein, partial [Paratractidigestivibacter sp.]|uniref:ABC transporter ATP-binding protein n=1 Tax=Paratractidigestivibacter sp. TaxID=2847316 RepID=UPI003A8CFF92
MAEIVLSHVKKVYPNESEKKGFFGKKKSKEKKHNLQVTDEGVLAVQDFNLTVHDHEFVVFVGPSGCGKSTMLNIIAGLLEPTSGNVYLDGKPIEGTGVERGVVFQQYALFPWRTVIKNVMFGLEMKKVPKDQAEQIARKYIKSVGLEGFEHSYPKELSGGM